MKRDFKGIWIPKEVWISKDLSVMEKLFLVEIDSLDNESGCFASNKYFAEFFNISKSRCSQIINSLEKKNYLKINIKRDGKQIIERAIKVVNKLNRVVNKLNLGSKNIKPPYLENAKDNNTVVNNTNNNNIGRSKYFYETELKENKQNEQIKGYSFFYDLLLGKTKHYDSEMGSILKINKQVSYNNFIKLTKKAKGKKPYAISSRILSMSNDDKYTRGKKDLYLMLNKWLDNDY